MYSNSRIGIYNYVAEKIKSSVTNNVYTMNTPQELTKTDVQNGFVVVRVGDINDESEFSGQAYGWARVFIEAYIPPKSRGRIDKTKYSLYEDGINSMIRTASSEADATYSIREDSIVSMDVVEESNANNIFFLFIKSFIVNIDEET